MQKKSVHGTDQAHSGITSLLFLRSAADSLQCLASLFVLGGSADPDLPFA